MLTAQKRKFALALTSGMSKKDAAIKAGYSERSARSKGSQLARDPEVIAFIDRKKREKVETDDHPTHGKKVNTPAVNKSAETEPDTTIPEPHHDAESTRRRQLYKDPMDYLMAVMNGEEDDDLAKRDAAKSMLPYYHSKKGVGGKKDAKNAAAKVAASKFQGMAAPKLIVNN